MVSNKELLWHMIEIEDKLDFLIDCINTKKKVKNETKK